MGPVTRYPALDGIRAIAAIGVVATHAAYWTGSTARTPWAVPGPAGLRGGAVLRAVGVPAVPALAARGAGGLRRAVGPALPVAPGAADPAGVLGGVARRVVALVPSVDGTGPQGLLRSLTLTQIYGDDQQRTGLTQMWSLATEVVFYCCCRCSAGSSSPCWRPAPASAADTRRLCRAGWTDGGLVRRDPDRGDVRHLVGVLAAELPRLVRGGMALAVLAVWWETDRNGRRRCCARWPRHRAAAGAGGLPDRGQPPRRRRRRWSRCRWARP